MVQDLETTLELESPETRMKLVPMFLVDPIPDLPGTKDLSPARPPTILGGTLSGLPCYYNAQESGLLILISTETACVTQGPKTTAAATTEEATVKEIPLKKKRSALPCSESSSIYLVLPSNAEKHKVQIKSIISKEKAKLCGNKFYNNIFEKGDFNIAFANSRNIKNTIARTKI